jgi:hypothetical protein
VKIKWVTQRMKDLMSDEDRAALEGQPAEVLPPEPKAAKRPKLEREEQRIFANWINQHELPRSWHRTDQRTGCDRGVWDFWTAANGRQGWFEFKLDTSVRLRPEQEDFGRKLVKENVECHVVTTADEAIAVVRDWIKKEKRENPARHRQNRSEVRPML